ncbi:MAG: MBL fold metallo-hydrolase [Nanoarchaeales archaeon]|nr:MBL fold metallo-hydrolase [Nanoarchaeales archaeon]
MKTFLLSTGSAGNSFYIESQNKTKVLVDCGLSYTKTKEILEEKNIDINELTAILITHEHSDHISGLDQILKQTKIPVYISQGTFDFLKIDKTEQINIVKHHDTLNFDDLNILVLNRAHDSREAISFIFNDNHKKLGIFTDLGHVDNESKHILKTLDIIYFEANYDDEIIAKNKDRFHYTYINRLTSNVGHLSLAQSIKAIKEFANNNQTIILSHISQNTNTYTNTYIQVKQALEEMNIYPNLHVGFQNESSDWF